MTFSWKYFRGLLIFIIRSDVICEHLFDYLLVGSFVCRRARMSKCACACLWSQNKCVYISLYIGIYASNGSGLFRSLWRRCVRVWVHLPEYSLQCRRACTLEIDGALGSFFTLFSQMRKSYFWQRCKLHPNTYEHIYFILIDLLCVLLFSS